MLFLTYSVLLRYIPKLTSICSLVVLIGCGGVIGNIEQYDYPVTPEKLTSSVEALYQKHPEWIPPNDSSIYHLRGNYFVIDESFNRKEYFIYVNSPKKIIFNFTIIDDPSLEEPMISLTRANYYGDTLFFARNLERVDRKLFQKLFEEVFITKLNKELNVVPHTGYF